MNFPGMLRRGESTSTTLALKITPLPGLLVGVRLLSARERAQRCHRAGWVRPQPPFGAPGSVMPICASGQLDTIKRKDQYPQEKKKNPAFQLSVQVLKNFEESSSHKEFFLSYSTSNMIIYRSGTYDRGTDGPHHGPKLPVLSTVQTEQRDDPFPKELTHKHKMEKSHY